MRKARKDGDEKQVDKLMKRQSAVVKMQTRANLEQMKTTVITFIPLLLVYRVILDAFPLSTAVAYSPTFITPLWNPTVHPEPNGYGKQIVETITKVAKSKENKAQTARR